MQQNCSCNQQDKAREGNQSVDVSRVVTQSVLVGLLRVKVVIDRTPSCGIGCDQGRTGSGSQVLEKKGQPELPLPASLRRVAGEIVQVRYGFGYLLSGACGACGAA